MKAKAATAWRWISEHWIAIAITALAVVGAIIGFRLLRRPLANSYARQVEVEKRRREIARLRGERDRLVEEVDEQDERVEVIDQLLADNRRRVVAAHQEIEELDDDEVGEAFARLGF